MTDWIQPLADLLREDRSDSRPPLSPERAESVARRYRAWLSRLESPPGDMERLWSTESRTWPADLFFHVGKPTILVAPQGHGKTNAAAFLVQMALRLRRDWDVYTNIPFPWDQELEGVVPKPPNLHSVHNAVDLMRGVANTILAGRRPAAVLDESGQWLSSHDWRSDAAEAMTKFVYVERHFRLRGPVLVYHTWKTVLEPFRQEGDLRGSYCRVIRAHGTYRIAREEDRTTWWGIHESDLPYLTVGLTGFDMNLDFQELGSRLRGSIRTVAQQVLDYLQQLEDRRAEEENVAALEARETHVASVANMELAVAEQHQAMLDRRERIIRRFMEDPSYTSRRAVREEGASSSYVAALREIARLRMADARPPGDEAYAVRQVPA